MIRVPREGRPGQHVVDFLGPLVSAATRQSMATLSADLRAFESPLASRERQKRELLAAYA